MNNLLTPTILRDPLDVFHAPIRRESSLQLLFLPMLRGGLPREFAHWDMYAFHDMCPVLHSLGFPQTKTLPDAEWQIEQSRWRHYEKALSMIFEVEAAGLPGVITSENISPLREWLLFVFHCLIVNANTYL